MTKPIALGGTGSGSVSTTGGASTDNAIARFDGTDGTKVQNSGVLIDDSNNVSGINALSASSVAFSTLTITEDALMAGSFCQDAAANDTYACNLSPAITSYVTGTTYYFKANTTNTGACTINFNSLGAKSIKKIRGNVTSDPADSDIGAGQWVQVQYDGTNMQLLSSTSPQSTYVDNTTTTLQGNAGDQNLYTTTVKLGDGKCLRATTTFTFSVATAVNKIMKWTFGANTLAYSATTSATTGRQGQAELLVCNGAGSHTTQQIAAMTALYQATFLEVTAAGTASGTNDTSGAITLSFIFNAASTETAQRRSFMIQYLP